jgi:hypothetical protein
MPYKISIQEDSRDSMVHIETYWAEIPRNQDIVKEIQRQCDCIDISNGAAKLAFKYAVKFFENAGFIPQDFEKNHKLSMFKNKSWNYRISGGKIFMVEIKFGELEKIVLTEPS